MERDLRIEALKDEINLGTLGVLGIVFFASVFNPLLLAIAAIFELTWILFVPDTFWFKQRVSLKYAQEDALKSKNKLDKWRQDACDQIQSDLLLRYKNLLKLVSKIREIVAEKDASEAEAYNLVADKAESLTDQFLKLSLQGAHYNEYINTVCEEAKLKIKPQKSTETEEDSEWVDSLTKGMTAYYQKQVDKIKKMLEEQGDPNSASARTISKQLQVISTRIEYINKIGVELVNLNHNLALIEATLGLLSDQVHAGTSVVDSINAVDETLLQASTMSKNLEEISQYQSINA